MISNKQLIDFCCRDFQPDVLMEQIHEGHKEEVRKWNIQQQVFVLGDEETKELCEQFNTIFGKGVLITIDSLTFKGFVFVSLSFLDLYDVRMIDQEGELLFTQTELYHDQLFGVINNFIKKHQPQYMLN